MGKSGTTENWKFDLRQGFQRGSLIRMAENQETIVEDWWEHSKNLRVQTQIAILN